MRPDTAPTVGPFPALDILAGGEPIKTGWKWRVTMQDGNCEGIECRKWHSDIENLATELENEACLKSACG